MPFTPNRFVEARGHKVSVQHVISGGRTKALSLIGILSAPDDCIKCLWANAQQGGLGITKSRARWLVDHLIQHNRQDSGILVSTMFPQELAKHFIVR